MEKSKVYFSKEITPENVVKIYEVVSHFKGHPMGGYGGAIKQLSIGCASSVGWNIGIRRPSCNRPSLYRFS